jgi:hypothetical protein
MSTLALEPRIEADEQVSLNIEAELKRILAEEGKAISGFFTTKFPSVRELALTLERKFILPYSSRVGINVPDEAAEILGVIESLDGIRRENKERLTAVQNKIGVLVKKISFAFRKAYTMIYQGCCDIAIQRSHGVLLGRSDHPWDYLPSSDNNRPGRFAGKQTVGVSAYLEQEDYDDND